METGGFPVWRATRRKLSPDAPFFTAPAKQVTLDLTEDDKAQLEDEELWVSDLAFQGFKISGRHHRRDLSCPIIGCGARLISLADFEDHYYARHTATCSVCSRIFPTNRLLNIHVAESHDSFFQAKADRGYPMYECLVEGCGMKFNNDRGRHQHLVDKHKFPTSFEFQKKQHLSKRRRQRLRAQVCSNANAKNHPPHASAGRSKMCVEPLPDQEGSSSLNKNDGHSKSNAEEGNEDMSMEVEQTIEDLACAVSKLSTQDGVPKTVSFGHRHNGVFTFLPRSMHWKTG